jgi:hypothetical protein
MSNLTAFALPDALLEAVQIISVPNSAVWQTSAGWTGGPAQFTSTETTYSAVAACSYADGFPRVFKSYGQHAVSLELTVAGTDQNTPYTWQALPAVPPLSTQYANLAFADLCAAQLADGTAQVFGTVLLEGAPAAVLISCYQATPNAVTYQNWTQFNTPSPLWNNNGVRSVTLPDGRLQLWALAKNGSQQEIVTCYKKTTQTGSAWSAWSTVASNSPALQFIAGARGPTSNLLLNHRIYHNTLGYLFGITEGTGQLLVASFSINAASPSPASLDWTPMTSPPGLPAGTKVYDLATTTLPNGGIQLFILVTANPYGPDTTPFLYTQYLEPALPGLREYWTWSGWQALPTFVS